MYTTILDKYKKSFTSKLYHIDGKIITNKYFDKVQSREQRIQEETLNIKVKNLSI